MSDRATIDDLAAIVGRAHVLTGDRRTRRFRRGYRFGEGRAIAVLRPGTLLELWRVIGLCAARDLVVVMQAANTGLTGGSTPDGDGYDRDLVIVSTLRLDGIRLLGDGRQVVCHAGATLNALEERLKPLGREPHSVIGSSCIGASVIGGIANNSGGSLIRRGPAYTEMALFARIDADGTVGLVNRLGVDLGHDAEEILSRLDSGAFAEQDVRWDDAAAHDADYATRVRDLDAATPARFNGDTRRMVDAAGSAGHVVIFAVRLDTFAAERDAAVFYIGSNDPADLQAIRRRFLADTMPLPIAAEYMHREAFDLADHYGKDSFLLIERLGTARIPALFAWKARLDTTFERLPLVPATMADRLMQAASRLAPDHLPPRLRQWRDRFEHHLILKVGATETAAAAALLGDILHDRDADHFRCTPQEGAKAFLHRFVAAGAAIRFRALHPDTVEDIVAIDVALPRNLHDWLEILPPHIEAKLVAKLYYGHFFCHVLHQDYAVAEGHDCHAIEQDILALLKERGCRYPAEHNYGHLYTAEPEVLAHYRTLDPCNCLNPGIGKSSKDKFWAPPSLDKVACHDRH